MTGFGLNWFGNCQFFGVRMAGCQYTEKTGNSRILWKT